MAIVKERILLCLYACSTFTPEPRAACGRFHILDWVLICLSKKRQQVTLDSDVSFVFAYELESLQSSSLPGSELHCSCVHPLDKTEL